MMLFTTRQLRAGFFIGALCLPAFAAAKDFRSSDVHPPDYPTVLAVKQMGKTLSEQSQGKLGIRVYASGSLGSEKDNIEQLKIGALDMMRINNSVLNTVVPETMAIAMPFVFRSQAHLRRVLDGPIGEQILKSMESQGMIGLAFYDSGARSFYSAKRPIQSLADMKGLKIRVQQSDLSVEMIKALGASPTPMPFGEVYTALKTGLVDAAENNLPAYDSSRHFEAAKYFSVSEHAMPPEVLVFSKKKWDTLSAGEQQLIRKAAKESVMFMRRLWDEREASARKKVGAAGVKINTIQNRQEFANATRGVVASFTKNPALKSLVQQIEATE